MSRVENVISKKVVSRAMLNKIPLHLRTRVLLVRLEMRFAYGSPYAVQVPEGDCTQMLQKGNTK